MLMLGFCALAPVGDALAKILGARMGLGQLVLARFALQAAVLAPLAFVLGDGLRMSARAWRLTLVRTVLHVAAIWAFFLALRALPLAEAVAIAYVMPFVLLLLGRFAYGEAVGPRRLAACGVGFLGTMLVVQPSFAEVGPAALLPILVAALFALFMVVTRTVSREVDPITLQAANGLTAVGLLVPLMIAGGALGGVEFAPTAVSGRDWALLGLMGAAGTLGHLFMTWSLRFAPSATVAPMQYLEIPFATLVGFAVFGHLPNGLAALGIAVTIGAGLYVLHRERAAGAGA